MSRADHEPLGNDRDLLSRRRAIKRIKFLPDFFPDSAKCSPGRSEDGMMFYPDERCRGGQQHGVTRLDESLRQPGMSIPETAKREGLEAQVSGLFIENTLAELLSKGELVASRSAA